jgi:hypothetical protein
MSRKYEDSQLTIIWRELLLPQMLIMVKSGKTSVKRVTASS